MTFDVSTKIKNDPNNPYPSMSALTYNWTQNPSNGNSIGDTPSINVCPTKSTQYIVTVTDKNNCVNADTINVYFRGPLTLEVLNQSTCCSKSYKVNVKEMPCSTIDALQNSTYPYTISWTKNGQIVSNSNTYNPPENGGLFNVSVSNACHSVTNPVNVSVDPIRNPNANGGTVIAFDQQVFNGNPMPIYHYDPSGHLNSPVNWFGSPAYNAYGYRIEVYYRWNATSFDIAPANLARVYETFGCNTISNGDIQIDGYNSSGNYMQPGSYLFRIWLKDCRGELHLVNKMWRKKLVCNGYTTYWLNAACGYCVIPQKICTSPTYVEEVVNGYGIGNSVFHFFVF